MGMESERVLDFRLLDERLAAQANTDLRLSFSARRRRKVVEAASFFANMYTTLQLGGQSVARESASSHSCTGVKEHFMVISRLHCSNALGL